MLASSGSRFQIESRPSQNAVIGRELKKTRGEHRPSLGEMESRLIEHHVMAGGLGTQPHAKLDAPARKLFQAQLLKIVQRQRLRDSVRRRGFSTVSVMQVAGKELGLRGEGIKRPVIPDNVMGSGDFDAYRHL